MPIKEALDSFQLELLAEQDLSRLQRQYRLIEGDRFTYSGNVNTNFMRQAKLIDILKKEEHDILAGITIATAKPWMQEDEENQKSLDNLLQTYEQVYQDSKVQKSQLIELKDQVYRTVVSQIQQQKSGAQATVLSDNQMFAKILAARKQANLFENRLDVMMKRFNVMNSANAELRNEIDHLLKERADFNEFWGKLIRCLTQGKKFMLDLIESATITYDQREEDCHKLEVLLVKTNEDLVVQSKNYRMLQRQLDHDLKLQEFLGLKSQIRIMAGLKAREEKKRQVEKQNNEKQMVVYKEVLKEIEDFCSETDYDKIAKKFKKYDEDNFALFNYINQMNNDAEAVSMNIEKLKRNIDAQRELNTRREKEQKETIENLDVTLEVEKEQNEKLQKMLGKMEKEANISLKYIESLYQLLGCDNSPLLALLGEYDIIKSFNVPMYMAMIEKRARELMQLTFAKEKCPPVDKSKTKTKKPKTASAPNIMKPEKPKQEVVPVDTLVPATPCPLCAEKEVVIFLRFFDDEIFLVYGDEEIPEKLANRLQIRVPYNRLHPVYRCRLPAAREIRQAKYK